MGDKERANKEQTTLEQSQIELKLKINRLVLVTSTDSSSLCIGGPFSNEKQLEIELKDIKIHENWKNWLGHGITVLVDSGTIESRLEILPRLRLMKRDKIKDKSSLKNILKWSFKGLKYEIQVEAQKRADLSTIILEIEHFDMKEQVNAVNYKSYNIVTVHKDEDEKENSAVSLFLDYAKDNGQYILKEGELDLFGVKIHDFERCFSYFDTILGKIPSFMTGHHILFPKETTLSVRSEKTYIRIFHKRPYYKTLGSFLVENSLNLEKSMSQSQLRREPEDILSLEASVADCKVVYEIEENEYVDISSVFEAIVEIKLGIDYTVVRFFHSPIKIVFNTKNLLHFFDEENQKKDTYLPIPLQGNPINIFGFFNI